MRLMGASRERARERARIVLPTPGTSSTSTWPRATRAATTVSTAARLPRTTLSTLRTTRARGASAAVLTAASISRPGERAHELPGALDNRPGGVTLGRDRQ